MNSPWCDHDGQNTNSVYGKLAALKIANVLYSNKYCCICLETCDGLLDLNSCGAVDGGEKNLMILTLREMLEAIFDDTVLHILRDSSNHICPVCTDSIQKTLSFIQKTKTHALIFAKYFTTLTRLSENLLQLGYTENLCTVVLNASLDNLPKDIKSANDVQSEGAKRKKEDESPRVWKKAKMAEGRGNKIETVDVDKEERDTVVAVNTEGNELTDNDKAPCNSDKDNQELRQISEPTAPVTKECCPVCKKRPCVHENYLAAFEKRQRNRIIECPECKEMLYTLTDLIKHVNMDHFKSKPTIRDVCNKIFQRDLVIKDRGMKEQVHPNLETKESENDQCDQFIGEIVNEEPLIGAEIIVQEETQENNEEIQHDEEKCHVQGSIQDKANMSDLIIKSTKILHLNQGLEENILNFAVSSIKDMGTILEQTDSNIESGSIDTEEIIQEIEVHSSDEQSIDNNVIKQTLITETGVHIVSEPNQYDTSNNLVESNITENGKILHLKSDRTVSDVQKKVLTGILKKSNTPSKKQLKSVRFGDCPTLSDWRKEFIIGDTDVNENAKIDAETKTSEEAKENEIISVNKDDVNKKRKYVDTLNSKSSSSPLVRKGLFNRPIRRDFSIVLTDIFKNRNLAASQMPISVYDDRYKNIISNLNKGKTVGSEYKKPVNSATENVAVNEITVINEADIHKGLENTELKVTFPTDLPKTDQEASLTCKEKPLSGIFESTKVSRKRSSKKKELPEVGARPTDTLQNDSDLNQNPEIPKNVQKEVADISQLKTVNPEPLKLLKSTQHQINNTPPNKNDTMNTQKIIHEPANNALKTGCNDVQKEGRVTDVTNEKNGNYKPEQPLTSPIVCVSKHNDLNTQTDNDLKTAQEIVEYTKGQSPCKETSDKCIIRSSDVKILNMEKKSPTKKDSSNEHSSIHAQANIVLKTAQVIVEKVDGHSPCKENTEKRINILNDEKIFNIERSPHNKDSTVQCLIHAETNELKATKEIVSKSKIQSSSFVVRPNNQRIKKTFSRKRHPYKKVCKNTYKIIRELKKGEIITETPNNGGAPNKKPPFTQITINESTKTQLKLAQESVGMIGLSECIEEGEIKALRPSDKVFNIEKSSAPSNMKPLSNTQNILQEQTYTELNQQGGQANNEELDKTSVGQSTCIEGETSVVKPNHDRVSNLYTKVFVSPNKKNTINKKSLINEKTDSALKFSQELLGQTKVQLACLEEGEIITVRPNNNKLCNLEKKIPSNKKDSGKTYNVIRKLEKGEIITVTPNNEQVYNLDRTLFESPNKEDSTKTQYLIPTNNEVERTKEVPISQQNRTNNTVITNSDKVVRMERKLLALSETGKKLRREVKKKPIVSSLHKKNGTKNRLSQKAVQNNPIRKGPSTIVHKQQKTAEESDDITEEIKGPSSLTEIIEEENIIEKNEKHALTYEKQRRGRTFECPECKKMLYSLKDLIAHVNKNNCKKARRTNDKEGQEVSSKDNIQRLKPVTIPTLVSKKAYTVPTTSKRKATSLVAGEAENKYIKEHVNNKAASKKKTQKETDAICTKCNVVACKHDRYRQAYDKLRKNKACKCPECKQMMHTLSGFIAHVNKSHVESKIVLRDIYYNDFPSTFVQTYKKSEKVDSAPKNKVSRDTEMEMNVNCMGHDNLETETHVEEFEVEFLEDLDELEEIQESHEANVSSKDKTTENKPSEPLKYNKCQLMCPDEVAYTQHRQEHGLLEDLYKEVTAGLELENRMDNETETVITEGNKRSHKCGTCGLICNSRMQLTLHLKSSGHFLQGTTSCPQCAKRPCRHEKYLCAYETKKTTGTIECFECQTTQTSLDALIAHVNTEHLIKSIKCDGCNQMVRGNLFKKHNKQCLKPQVPVKCTKCPALFVNEEAYMVHNLEHELLELNEVSAKNVAKTPKEPENSEIIDDEKIYECGTCGKIFRHRSWLKLHLKATNHVVKRDLSCLQCSKRPCKHEEYLLLFENQNEKNKLKCQQCKDSLDSLSNYIAHVNKDHLKNKAIKCDCCKEEFYLKSQLITHLKVHEPKLTCEHCFCEFRRSLFRKHKIKCQNAKKRVKCAKCPALFPNEKAYTIHKQEHPELLENTETTSVIKTVTGDRIISRERSNKNKYDCPICHFHCSRREKLSTHLNSTHKMESRRTCSVCVKVFATRQKYIDHREAQENKCSIYEKERRQTRDPSKKRSCNICKKMISREAMALHLRMHCKDCPYPCHGCSMRFKRSSERALHVLKVHSGR